MTRDALRAAKQGGKMHRAPKQRSDSYEDMMDRLFDQIPPRDPVVRYILRERV